MLWFSNSYIEKYLFKTLFYLKTSKISRRWNRNLYTFNFKKLSIKILGKKEK